jgi:HEPN domain-containing protein
MAIEVSSKAVLFAMGIDFPKQHDVSAVFREVGAAKSIPRWFPTERLASNISTFAEMRALAEYAYEQGLGEDHFKGDAESALKDSKAHVADCRRLLRELFGERSRDERTKREGGLGRGRKGPASKAIGS